MYANETSYNNIFRLLKAVVERSLPIELLGASNTKIFVAMLKDFISMKRYENYKIEDIVAKMDAFGIPWA